MHYSARRDCTCGTWDRIHEPQCEINREEWDEDEQAARDEYYERIAEERAGR